MENKQTAVEWLIKEIEFLITIETFQRWKVLKEQAKQMEKEQVELRYKDGTPMRKYNSSKLQAIENEISDDLLTEEEIAEFKRELKEVMKKPKTEISDEEIDKIAKEFVLYNESKRNWVVEGMKLYREHLKK